MEPGVVVALIAAFASLIVTFGKASFDAYQKRQESRRADVADLRRYRTLLLSAADDLGNRIGNIRYNGFFVYLREGDRSDIALSSTLFRLGQYFTWTEIYREYLRLNPDRDTGQASDVLDRITTTFASDLPDRTDEHDFRTSRLMMWREEQLAVGHLMRRKGPVPACISFDTFVDKYDSRYSGWFQRFGEDLKSIFAGSGSYDASKRLTDLQELLARLVVELDVEKSVVRLENGKILRPIWAQRSQYRRQ